MAENICETNRIEDHQLALLVNTFHFVVVLDLLVKITGGQLFVRKENLFLANQLTFH